MKHDLFPLPSYLYGSIKELPRNFSHQNKAYYTLFFYKNIFYKNIEPEIWENFKNKPQAEVLKTI